MWIDAFLFLLVLSIAKSKEDHKITCKNDYRDLNNSPMDVLKFCSNNLCIEKCCGSGEIIVLNKYCINKTYLFKNTKNPSLVPYIKSKVNYSNNILSSRDDNKKSKYNFTLVQNNRNIFKCSALPTTDADSEYDISEDGSLRWQHSVSKKWNRIEKLKYCLDYQLVLLKPENNPHIKIIFRQFTADPKEAEEIEAFEIVALLISSFFMMLVLVVYCLIPNLRNLSGLVLMAYTFTLLFAFVNKVILNIIKRKPPEGFCEKFSPVVYFGFMSSIFWLNVISFDVWWGLRSIRIKRSSKRSELVKFLWYAMYAWGTPLLLTATVIMLDNIDDLYLLVEPPFKRCLPSGPSHNYYFKIPIAILIFINIVLFFMTVYNIWMVKHGVNKCSDSRISKQQNNKFGTYVKLSVMMGLSWCLELLPAIDILWFYILTNLYNLLTGVFIFYWFVCQKKILLQLCKKFNIRNDFITKLETQSSQPKSGITRTTGVASSIVKTNSKTINVENIDLLKNCPEGDQGESPIV